MIKTAVIRKIPENNNKIKLILFSILLFCIVMLVLSNECIIDEPIINKTNIMLILLLFSGIFLITAVLIINYFLKSDIESILMIIVGSSVLSKYGITYIPKTSLIVYFILLITNQFKIFMEWKKNG